VGKGGVDDAMFCEACGAHRDQLGVAGENMQLCPDCGRATCANCWNQVAGGCLSCRAFALPVIETATTARQRPKAGIAAAGVVGVAATSAIKPKPTSSTRRFKRGTRPQPDPVVTQMPGVVAPVVVAPVLLATAVKGHAPVQVAARTGSSRFGHIRLGRVVRATAIGSALAVSVAAVVFAGVVRLAPGGGGTNGAPETTQPGLFGSNPGAAITPGPDGTLPPVDPTATNAAGDPTVTPTSTDPQAGPGSTGGPSATLAPGATPTPKPTAGATASPGATATPVPTPDPPTPDPTP